MVSILQLLNIVINDLKIDGDRMRGEFDALAEIGSTQDGGVSRLALSAADIHARAWFAEQIEAVGLVIRDDDAANLSGILLSDNPEAKTLIIGSHLDTVPNGGLYDGSVGILAALECVRTIAEAELRLPINLEVMDFTDDEGCWASLFGARALAGKLQRADVFDDVQDNVMFRAALKGVGFEPRNVFRARRDPETLAGYLELHVEHGTRLERANLPIGIVSGVVGRKAFRVRFEGLAGHSGTTDMYHRRDALRGAALFIVRAHDLIRERYGDGIFNCGDVGVLPGKFNIVPNQACCTVEVRHVDEKLMGEMETAILSLARECATSYDLSVTTEQVSHMPAATMTAGMLSSIEAACEMLDVQHMPLVSYAGHAAQVMSSITECGMIFIPSKDGVGHSPKEFTEWDDIVRGANVLLHSILNYAARFE